MKCFIHNDADAIGLCRNCSRGVCPACAADLAAGIACKSRCEEAVEAMAALVGRNVAMGGKRVSAGHWLQFFFYLFAGPGGLLFGALLLEARGGPESQSLGWVLVVCGALFSTFAINYGRWIHAGALKPKVAK